MSDFQTILRLARRSLLVLGGSLLVALATYLASGYFKDRLQTQLTTAQQTANTQQASLSEKQTDLANLQTEIDRFNQLRQEGLVGAPDREGWTEQLVASRVRLGLPPTLLYTLQPPQPLAQQDSAIAPSAANVDGTAAVAVGPQFHDLDLAMTDIQEEELLALLRDYRAHVKGHFRVNLCTLSTPTPTGLSARCTLRFFTLPDAKPAPGLP
jgi:hypothetical protein